MSEEKGGGVRERLVRIETRQDDLITEFRTYMQERKQEGLLQAEAIGKISGRVRSLETWRTWLTGFAAASGATYISPKVREIISVLFGKHT